MTPLYKSLRQSGTSFYCFPGAAEDINKLIQNGDVYKLSFDKFVLLDLPKQNLVAGTSNSPIQFDFDKSFYRTSPAATAVYSDLLIESLRNYVANHEITLRESKTSNNEYFYNPNILATTTERIFWKWCRDLNLIQLEKATPQDEYFDTIQEFERNVLTDDEYFPEVLWRERSTANYNGLYYYETGTAYTNKLEVEYASLTNFRAGDIVYFNDIQNSQLTYLNGLQLDVLEVIAPSGLVGQRVIYDISATGISGTQSDVDGQSNLVYNKLVRYIGEITAVNNVQEANRAYTEVYAHIGDSMGQTPDILFRLKADDNYKPNLEFPILPSQYQPEIIGAENFQSPIVNSPQNYPGDYYGQFDTSDLTYQTATGDLLRRSGAYYGIFGDVNNITIDPSEIDGITVDFDPTHYVKMNLMNQEVNNFDEFNQLPINNVAPEDFEFNAILWYYTVTDANGNSQRNLYGVSFVDHPQNNPNPELAGKQIPTYRKLVNNGSQDGTSYAFSLNLNYDINNDQIQPQFNSNNVNALFSFNLFNEAMKRLASANDSFLEIITNQSSVEEELQAVKGLLYNQTDLTLINSKISQLENLLKLYQSMQIVSSDTINVQQSTSGGYPVLTLSSVDTAYHTINNINSTDLYNSLGIIPIDITPSDNKNFLLRVINNDETPQTLLNDDKLTIAITTDLSYKQSFDLVIDATSQATQNKKLDVFINYSDGIDNIPTMTELISNIDLPIYYNTEYQQSNSAKNWAQIKLDIDLSIPVQFQPGNLLNIGFESINGFKKGDCVLLNNFILGLSSSIDYSGQYLIDNVATASNTLTLNISSNPLLLSYYNTNTTRYLTTDVASITYLTLNKGYKFKVTRVDQNPNSDIVSRYLIEGGLI